ncbi:MULTISPECIES: hypothetical protein [unclassified Microcoleus]|uniref:hypothetical protein n=1 Tax=unclassified Microcoleus TaxID=2642155 RepID=UPI002FD74338
MKSRSETVDFPLVIGLPDRPKILIIRWDINSSIAELYYVKAVCAIIAEHLCAASSTATGRSSHEEFYHVGSIERSKIRSRVRNAGIAELSGRSSAISSKTQLITQNSGLQALSSKESAKNQCVINSVQLLTNCVYSRLLGVSEGSIAPSNPDSGMYCGKCVWREMSVAAKSAIG